MKTKFVIFLTKLEVRWLRYEGEVVFFELGPDQEAFNVEGDGSVELDLDNIFRKRLDAGTHVRTGQVGKFDF